MRRRVMQLLPLLLALVTLGVLAWLAGSILFTAPEQAPEAGSDTRLGERYRQFESYPLMARAYQLIDAGKPDAAADWLAAALQDDPGNLAAMVQLADLRLQQGRPAEAVELAERAVQRRPADSLLHWLLARAMAAAGNFAGALDAVDQALGQGMWTPGLKEPERGQAELARLGYLLELGRADAAQAALDGLPDAPPEDLLRLGDLYYGAGDFAQARQLFAAARDRLKPGEAGALWAKAVRRLAEVALKTGDDAAAAEAWQALVAQQPDDTEALQALANLAEAAGRPAEAAGWLARKLAVEAGGDAAADVVDRQRLARLQLEAGEPEAAAATLQSVPDAALDSEGLLLKARVLLAAGQPGAAARLFQEAAARSPGQSGLAALRSAAEAWREAGDVEAELALRRRIVAESGLESDRSALVETLVANDRLNAAASLLAEMVEAGDPGTLDRLVAVLVKADRAEQGIAMLERQGHLVEAAELAANVRRWREAARLFLAAFRQAGAQDPHLLRRAIYAAQQAGSGATGADVLQAAFPFAGLPPADRRAFTLQLVQDLERAGQPAQADHVLAEMARSLDDPALALDLATRLSAQGRCREALDWAGLAMAAADPPARLYALSGFCAARLGQDAQALADLRQAVALADAAGAPPEIAWLNALGYQAAAAGRPLDAARAWQRSLQRRFDPEIALALSAALRSADEGAQADRWLALIDPADLPQADRGRYYDQMALAAAAAGDRTAAAMLLRQAIALAPDADRWFRLGTLESERGNPAAALTAYRQAAALAPDNAAIQASMGYAQVALGDDAAAEAHFERAIALDPQGMDAVYEDSAYANKRLARNAEAVARFKVAIARTPETGPEDIEKRFRLRREVEQLENRWTVTANATVTTLEASAGAPSPIRDVANGNGAVEAAWQPPVIGFRDGRTVQLFSRLFWNAEDGSLKPQRDSLQAGIGARYKPLTNYNLVLSFERLVAIGAFAYDDWLARASISFDQNLDWQPVRRHWPTGSLYFDAARALGERATYLTTIGRWGYAWKKPFGIGLPDAADAINTYGLATASQSIDPQSSTGRVELGGGVSYKLWFNDTPDEAFRSTAEIGLEGRYLFQNNAEDSAALQLRLQFRL